MPNYTVVECSLNRGDVHAAHKNGSHPLVNALYRVRPDLAKERYNINAGFLTQAYLMWGKASKNVMHWWRDWKPYKLSSEDLFELSKDPVIFPPVFHFYLLDGPRDVYSRGSWNECVRILAKAQEENDKYLRPANSPGPN